MLICVQVNMLWRTKKVESNYVFIFLWFFAAAADNNRQLVSKAELDYIEERALLETQRETVGSLGTIPF